MATADDETRRPLGRSNSATGESLYEVLGIKKPSNPDEIKRAYRRLALKYHPDKNQSSQAEEIFKEINHAHAVLKDEQKKKIYDSYGSVGLKVAEQIGEENMALYACLDSKLMKCCLVFTFCCTGCCFCCFFCCCCCFCCCCGLCAPKEREYDVPPDLFAQDDEPIVHQPTTTYHSADTTEIPTEDAGKKPTIALGPPSSSSDNDDDTRPIISEQPKANNTGLSD